MSEYDAIDWLLSNGRITEADLDEYNQLQMSAFDAMVARTSEGYYDTPDEWYKNLVKLLVSFNKILDPMIKIRTQQGRGKLHYTAVKNGGNAPEEGSIRFSWYRKVTGDWQMLCECC